MIRLVHDRFISPFFVLLYRVAVLLAPRPYLLFTYWHSMTWSIITTTVSVCRSIDVCEFFYVVFSTVPCPIYQYRYYYSVYHHGCFHIPSFWTLVNDYLGFVRAAKISRGFGEK